MFKKCSKAPFQSPGYSKLPLMHIAFAFVLALVGVILLLCGSAVPQAVFDGVASKVLDALVFPMLDWIRLHLGFGNSIRALSAHLSVWNISTLFRGGIVFGACLSIVLATLNLICASFLKARRHYRSVFFLSCANCLLGPIGLYVGLKTIVSLKEPALIAQFMFRSNEDEPKQAASGMAGKALLEVVRMPNPFHVGLVVTYFGENCRRKRTCWINGWFGLSIPISVTATVTKHSPYFLPYLPTSGPFIITEEAATRIEEMANAAQLFLDKNRKPYSFVPGVLDGCWPLFAGGGHTSNNIVASLFYMSGVLDDVSAQCGNIEPWILAPGANPKNPRNIMPREWFEREGSSE